jgi:hypothetical protein
MALIGRSASTEYGGETAWRTVTGKGTGGECKTSQGGWGMGTEG